MSVEVCETHLCASQSTCRSGSSWRTIALHPTLVLQNRLRCGIIAVPPTCTARAGLPALNGPWPGVHHHRSACQYSVHLMSVTHRRCLGMHQAGILQRTRGVGLALVVLHTAYEKHLAQLSELRHRRHRTVQHLPAPAVAPNLDPQRLPAPNDCSRPHWVSHDFPFRAATTATASGFQRRGVGGVSEGGRCMGREGSP
jgi:hypothetical protein